MNDITDLIADWRSRIDALGLSDKTIARVAGICGSQMSKILGGKSYPQRTTVKAIESAIAIFEAIPGLRKGA